MNMDKLYPIVVDLGRFGERSKYYPGVTPGGEQVIIFAASPMLHAYRFDAEGRYLGREDRVISEWPADAPPEQRRMARLAAVLAWAGGLGLTPATIRVRKFHSELDGGPLMEIRDEPRYFEDGSLGSEEEREATLRWWRDLGAFVLFWNTTEHTLDGEGKRFQ